MIEVFHHLNLNLQQIVDGATQTKICNQFLSSQKEIFIENKPIKTVRFENECKLQFSVLFYLNFEEYQNNKSVIEFKEAIIQSFQGQAPNFQYKDWKQTTNEISETIKRNINPRNRNKLYLVDKIGFKIVSEYQRKHTMLLNSIQNRTQHKPKFKINKSALSTDSQDKMLLDSQLLKKFQFFPVQTLQHQKSKFQSSVQEIYKLKKNLSFMIQQIKMNQSSYPQADDIQKPYIDFHKTKQQLKFRKKLENNISEIHQQNQRKKKQSDRLYTSPDPMDDSYNENKYAQAYGFLFHQNPEMNKRKKKSNLKRQLSRQKSTTNISRNKNNLSRTKLMPSNKNSRQVTQQASHIIIASSNAQNKKSKSKLKGSSKNKIFLVTSTSRNKIKTQKSLNKSRKLLQHYKY